RPPLPRGARGAPSRPLLENARRLTRARGRALLVVLAAALLAACASLRAGDAGLVRITLLQINDVYVLGPVDGGHRGGMARLTTPETAWVSSPGPDVVFGDPRVAGGEAAARLRARGARVVVAVTHQGMAADRALAAATGPDVILGGHEHEPLIAEEGKTLITKAGSDARYLVQVDLWVARDGPLVERSWTFREVSRRVPPDPAVEALVQGYARRLEGD